VRRGCWEALTRGSPLSSACLWCWWRSFCCRTSSSSRSSVVFCPPPTFSISFVILQPRGVRISSSVTAPQQQPASSAPSTYNIPSPHPPPPFVTFFSSFPSCNPNEKKLPRLLLWSDAVLCSQVRSYAL